MKDDMLIEKYTSQWVEDFESLKFEIERGLNGLNPRIEHVGSTSVPHLDSKPIIDLDIIYEIESEFKLLKAGLTSIGYYHNGDQGIENREVFKRDKKNGHPVLDSISHHLYVCQAQSAALQRHILTRDFLRKNDWARTTYQAMKYELAERANQDKKRYGALKEVYANTFFDEIIENQKSSSGSRQESKD
ncbi:MAG: hypothetical protein COA80_18315 [Leeuwenhoekiella sp.]|nr:MAG: hypothetical protein COA80_18315 [Leeuwenhoekiella sp.]